MLTALWDSVEAPPPHSLAALFQSRTHSPPSDLALISHAFGTHPLISYIRTGNGGLSAPVFFHLCRRSPHNLVLGCLALSLLLHHLGRPELSLQLRMRLALRCGCPPRSRCHLSQPSRGASKRFTLAQIERQVVPRRGDEDKKTYKKKLQRAYARQHLSCHRQRDTQRLLRFVEFGSALVAKVRFNKRGRRRRVLHSPCAHCTALPAFSISDCN